MLGADRREQVGRDSPLRMPHLEKSVKCEQGKSCIFDFKRNQPSENSSAPRFSSFALLLKSSEKLLNNVIDNPTPPLFEWCQIC